MTYNIKNYFLEAEHFLKCEPTKALEIYEKIIKVDIGQNDKEGDKNLYRILAFSNYRIFSLTALNREECANNAIKYFEKYLYYEYLDIEAQELYINTLELNYQYAEAYKKLVKMLKDRKLNKIALKFLSSYVYVGNGMESFDEMINYKKKLIEIEEDIEEKRKLQHELRELES